MRIRWSLVLVLFLVGSTLAACGTPAPAVTEAPVVAQPTDAPTAVATAPEVVGQAPASILIGVVIAQTGPLSANGAQIQNGYEMAVADINAKGGIMVKQYNAKIPLELKIVDNGSDPTKVGPALDALNTEDHVVAYLGANSAPSIAAAPVAEKNQIPYVGVAFAQLSIHQKGYKYLFSPFPKSPGMAKSMFDMLDALPADKKPTKVGILTEKSDFGTELAGLWTQEAGARGYQVVSSEQFDPSTTDYADSIQKTKSANAEVVVGVLSAANGIAIEKEMVKQSYLPKFTMFVRGADAPTWPTDTEMAGDYVAICPGWSNAMKYPGVDQLNAAYQAKVGHPADPLVGPAYASVQLLADAIERVGSLDHDAIRKAFATTDLQTVVGPVTFNPDGTGNVSVPILQYQKGKVQLVWPKEFATADLVYPALPYDQR